MTKGRLYKVKVVELKDNQTFPCPNCGAKIDPTDDSDTIYKVVKTNLDKKSTLKSMIIDCLGCKDRIELEYLTNEKISNS